MLGVICTGSGRFSISSQHTLQGLSSVVSCVARKPLGLKKRAWSAASARVSHARRLRGVAFAIAFFYSAYTRENLRKTEATPTTSAACTLWVRLRRLRLVWCGLRLRGATSAIKERCLLYQCLSHLLTLSILTHEVQCCTYRERATKHARMQSALR